MKKYSVILFDADGTLFDFPKCEREAFKEALLRSDIVADEEMVSAYHKINDDLLFTHFGIGGPAAYRTSLYDLNDGIYIDFLPNADISNIIQAAKQKYGKKSASTILAQYLPVKLVKWIVNNIDKNVADLNKQDIQNISCKTHKFYISATDIKRHNLQSAEIVRGGVATDDISSKTMESKLCDGLFFVGEVIDIAGDLGGFNLHWAWASGIVAGNNA